MIRLLAEADSSGGPVHLQWGAHDVGDSDKGPEPLQREEILRHGDEPYRGLLRLEPRCGAGVEDVQEGLPGEGVADVSGEKK